VDAGSLLAVDVGGTKSAFGLFDPAGRLLERKLVPTPHGQNVDVPRRTLEAARAFLGGRQVAACGVDLPAIVEGGVVIWAAQSVAEWARTPLRTLAESELGCPCAAEYDGYAAAVGEAWQGAAAGYQDAIVVVVGTGIGAGVIRGGELYRGLRTIAGGIGWTRLPCGEGLGERLEDVAAGPAILARARRLGDYATTAEVFGAAGAGDPAAGRVVQQAELTLAAALGGAAALLAPEVVVLGGSVGARDDVVAAMRRLVPQATQPTVGANLRIEASALGPLSSLYGAAYLARQLLQQRET
jgi:glucokinase